jgi:beta-phosphoglucomutase-like phosphatase (HAD superfamily)
VNRTAYTAAPPRLKGLMFDLDGTLLLSDRSLDGYEVLPGAAELLTELARSGTFRPVCGAPSTCCDASAISLKACLHCRPIFGTAQ